MPEAAEDAIEAILKQVHEASSLRFSSVRRANLEMQVTERMSYLGLKSIASYREIINEDTEEFWQLIESLTTKETYFFRLPGHFEGIRDIVLPEIEERLSEDLRRTMALDGEGPVAKPPLRVWSAGCSTGEEVYSLAMCILRNLKYPRAWATSILATDISRKALSEAEMGHYAPHSISKIPKDLQGSYVCLDRSGGHMAADLKRVCSFRIMNLHDFLSGGKLFQVTGLDGSREFIDFNERFDIVFCRNVMIYFDFEAQQRLVKSLYNCLRPGGYLFTGDAEVLHIYEHRFEVVHYQSSVFYKKMPHLN